MKLSDLNKVTKLVVKREKLKEDLKNLEEIFTDTIAVHLENNYDVYCHDDIIKGSVNALVSIHLIQEIKKVENQLKELGVEVDEISN